MLKELPRFECLLEAAEEYPTLSPSATEAFLNLLRTGDMVFEEESAFLARHSISQGRFNVLMLLHHCCDELSTPAALADHAGVARATMTGLLDTLEKDALVIRQADPEDRRVVLVSLTEAGRTLINRILPDYFECVSQMMEPLSTPEQRMLTMLLQKVQRGLAAKAAAVAEAKSAA